MAVVLATDLGPARKISRLRLLHPVLAAAIVIPLFVQHPAGSGVSLAVEIAGVAAGPLAGIASLTLMRVYRSPATGQPVTAAGWGCAAFWTVIIGARAAFSYGAAHWFATPLVTWAITHQVSENAIVDALIFMAFAMILVRTAGLRLRAARLPALTASTTQHFPVGAQAQPAPAPTALVTSATGSRSNSREPVVRHAARHSRWVPIARDVAAWVNLRQKYAVSAVELYA